MAAARSSMVGPLAGVGAGLRGPHVPDILAERPAIAWFELLTDNHLAAGGGLRRQAEVIAERYPVSLHGVGMSLAGTDPLDRDYLASVRKLAERTEARLVSEHLAFTSAGGQHSNDLLPIPWTEEALDHVAGRIDVAQGVLGRQILIENISAYVEFTESSLSETEFLETLCRRTGCALLLDINNVYVNAVNHGYDPSDWLAGVPWCHVREIHVAGHTERDGLLIDTHGGTVCTAVVELLLSVRHLAGACPVLLEWDTNLPPWHVLETEVERLQRVWDRHQPEPRQLRHAS